MATVLFNHIKSWTCVQLRTKLYWSLKGLCLSPAAPVCVLPNLRCHSHWLEKSQICTWRANHAKIAMMVLVCVHLHAYVVIIFLACVRIMHDRYSPQGWEKFFLPLSDTCTDRNGLSTASWGSKSATHVLYVSPRVTFEGKRGWRGGRGSESAL